MEELFLLYAGRWLRRGWYRFKRKWRKARKMWDRFKWCVIGGFAYAAGRYAFQFIKQFLETL